MANSEDNLLVYGGLAVAAYFVYQHFFANAAPAPAAIQAVSVSDPVTVGAPTVTNGPGPSGIWLGHDNTRRRMPMVPGTDSLSQQIQLPQGVQPPAAPAGYSWQTAGSGNGSVNWRLRRGYTLAVPYDPNTGTVEHISPPSSTL